MKPINITLSLAVLAAMLAGAGCRDDQSRDDSSAADSSTATTNAAAATDTAATTSPAVATATTAPTVSGHPHIDAEHWARAQKLMNGGAELLLAKRNENGAWAAGRGTAEPAYTAMVLKVLVNQPLYGPDHPAVSKAFDVLLKHKQPDGGIYEPSGAPASYTAAVALMALSAADKPEHQGHIRDLVGYLKGLQIVPGSQSSDGEAIGADDPRVGGVSYGKGPNRPDLSNVGMWMEALHEAGVDADDEAIQRAASFLSRLQNNTETNALDWAKEGSDDGGFIYTFPGGRGPSRGARSYGSMTYTGFKSLLYAGVKRNDPRVSAAFDWIRTYWRLDSNPNMPQAESLQGLYYYYQVFAKALAAWGEPVITDQEGIEHNWRHELIDALAQRVGPDGGWVNQADRWWEGDPVLCTCYAMLALQEATATAPSGASGEPSPAERLKP